MAITRMYGGKYGIKPYSRHKDVYPVWRERISFDTILDAYAAMPTYNRDYATFDTSISGSAITYLAILEKVTLDTTLSGNTKVTLIVRNDIVFNTSMQASAVVGGIFADTIHVDANMDAVAHVGGILADSAHLDTQLDATGYVGAVIPSSVSFETELMALSAIGAYEVETTVINVILPPHSRLVIDSADENYTAFIGNENVLHLYKGAWVKLTRPMRTITLLAENGVEITAKMQYDPRYL